MRDEFKVAFGFKYIFRVGDSSKRKKLEIPAYEYFMAVRYLMMGVDEILDRVLCFLCFNFCDY